MGIKRNIFLMLFILILPVYVAGDGCCIYEDALFDWAICQRVPEQLCCGDSASCDFEEGEDCYSAGATSNFPECDRGCCCVDYDDSGQVLATITTRAACSGDFQDEPAELVSSEEACANYCGGDYEPLPEITGDQCVYYYCGGDTFPEGPIPDEQDLNLQFTNSIFSGFDGKVTAGIKTADHYWLVNDDHKLFLFDSGRSLVPDSALDDFEMEENPSDINVLHEDIHNINSMADVSSSPGIIFIAQGDQIYRFTDSGLTSYTTESQAGYMTTYGSYYFGSYIMFHGSGDTINYFKTSSRSNPFGNKANEGTFSSVLNDIDAVLELNFDDSLPCLLIFGGCRVFSGCGEDEHCSDFNECTKGKCEGGECHFPQRDDGISCGQDGECCGGVCYTEGRNYEYHEDCRVGPDCDGTFLEYDSSNDGSICKDECYTCQSGFCKPDHSECRADDVEGVEDDANACCDEGECIPCEDMDDMCVEGEIDCPNDNTYRECEFMGTNGGEIGVWSEVKDCDTDVCHESVCIEGTGSDAGCSEEPMEEGSQDSGVCYNEEGCVLDGMETVCRCDANQECTAFCTDNSECEMDEDEPCKEAVCNTETGECVVEDLDEGTCTNTGGDPGFCEDGECETHECDEETKETDCPEPETCYDIVCEDGLCDTEPSPEDETCNYAIDMPGLCDGEGNCESVDCTEPDHCEDLSEECKEPYCDTNSEQCFTETVTGEECTIDDEDEGICYEGDCVECHEPGQCDDQNEDCFNNRCIQCKLSDHCDDNEVCVDEECVIDCTHDEADDCPDDTEHCNSETGECVECIPGEEDHCDDGKHCHNDKCVEDCEGKDDCSGDDVCVEGSCVECGSTSHCPVETYCDKDINECVGCIPGEDHCDPGNYCYIDECTQGCDDDDNCLGDDVCHEGECVQPCENDNECPSDKFCNTELNICVDCTANDHCDDGNDCTINECDTEVNECIEEYEETGNDCTSDDVDDGFCHQGECLEGCENDDECEGGVYDDKNYCYIPQGREKGVCVECHEESHCEVDDECIEVDACVRENRFECEYNYKTGTDCVTCDEEYGNCVCYEGNCIDQCFDDEDCSDDEVCGDEGYCVECDGDNECDDGNDCTINTCENGVCQTENKEDIDTRCGENNEGYCCSGNCVTDVTGEDFHNDCTDWGLNCNEATGKVEFEHTNHGELCGDSDCTVCNYGYCDHDDDTYCDDGEDCFEGECFEDCQYKCESGDSECMDGAWARLRECIEHPNLDDCYTWDAPEKCPDDTCKEPYCSEGECGKNPIASGQSDENCWNGYGCEEDICRCDGFGYCMAFECDTDSDCEDEELPCITGTCVGGECEFESKEDGTNCPGGACCGGVCQTTTYNEHFNESCRSDSPQCVGGSYEYIAENEGEICAGECSVCFGGTCYDNSSMCPEGQECENGECVGCRNRCEEGETECFDTNVQTCKEINGCMTWGSPEPCDDEGMCTKADCVNGECVVVNVDEGKTHNECYSVHGCEGDNCMCDGEGQCVPGRSIGPPLVPGPNDTKNGNGHLPDPVNGDNGDNGRVGEESMSFWWLLLLIILMVIVVGGFTGAYYYDTNYNQGAFINDLKRKLNQLSSKIKSLFGKSSSTPKQKMQGSFGPQVPGSHGQFRQSPRQGLPSQGYGSQSQPTSKPGGSQIKSQSPSQAGLSPSTSKPSQGAEPKKLDSALQKELYNYLQTLRQKGPDKNKELELIKKGVTTQKLKELYQIVRKENEKRAERKKKLAKFD